MAVERFPNARHRAFVGVGHGCGRWKTPASPNKTTLIRDPSRSETSAPSATKRASTSLHRIDPLTGRENRAAKVARCFFCTPHRYYFAAPQSSGGAPRLPAEP
jgi:hypothetical protein